MSNAANKVPVEMHGWLKSGSEWLKAHWRAGAAFGACAILIALAANIISQPAPPTATPAPVAAPGSSDDLHHVVGALESMKEEITGLKNAVAALCVTVDSVDDQLAHANRQLSERMAQVELREPIKAEIVTTKYATEDGRHVAVCRAFDRHSRGYWTFVVPLNDASGEAFVSKLSSAARQANAQARSFEKISNVLSQAGYGPIAPGFVWPEASFVFPQSQDNLGQLLTLAFGVDPIERQYLLHNRDKSIDWTRLVQQIATNQDSYEQLVSLPSN